MTFIIDGWTFQIVLLGGLALLEASKGESRLSLALDPMDSPRDRGFELLRHPSCALRAVSR